MNFSPLTWTALILFALIAYVSVRHLFAQRVFAYRHINHSLRQHYFRWHRGWHQHQMRHRFKHGGVNNLALLPIPLTAKHKSTLQHSREYCKEYTAQKISHILQRLENKIKPTPRQQEDWNTLQRLIRNESDFLAEICEKHQLSLKTQSAPARMELLATTKLMENESLSRIQPYILRLYLKLDEKQRIDFDRVFNWHYQSHWL